MPVVVKFKRIITPVANHVVFYVDHRHTMALIVAVTECVFAETRLVGFVKSPTLPHHIHLLGTTVVSTEEFVNVVLDRKSTRLNSSHSQISYAVFCLKKK